MTRDERILRDLTRHLRDKVLQDVDDHMDRCRTAQLEYHDVATELLVFFSFLASGYAAFQFEVDEEEFIHVMRLQFKRAIAEENKL